MPDRSGNRQPGIEPAAYVDEPGFTTVSLDLAERESVFVVLRNAASDARFRDGAKERNRAGHHRRAVDADISAKLGRSGQRANARISSRGRRVPIPG